MLEAGHQVPHFIVTTIEGTRVSYGEIWQRRNLLLVLLGGETSESHAYVERLRARMAELSAHDTTCLVTSEAVEDTPSPAAVVADRWGEICCVHRADSPAGLPPPETLIEWLRYVQMQCPECHGEVR